MLPCLSRSIFIINVAVDIDVNVKVSIDIDGVNVDIDVNVDVDVNVDSDSDSDVNVDGARQRCTQGRPKTRQGRANPLLTDSRPELPGLGST